MKKAVKFIFPLFFLTTLFFSGCASFVTNEVTPNIVKMGHSWLSPSEFPITQGMTVKWINTVDMEHTIISNSNVFVSRSLKKGETFSFRFTQPGIYEYHIKEHPNAKGKIIVDKSDSYVAY